MAESEPQISGPPAPARGGYFARSACRIMLLANLLLTGVLCLFVEILRNIAWNLPRPLPAMAVAFLSIPASAFWANSAGLAAILVLLVAFAPGRRITLAANAGALVLLLSADVLVEILLFRS